MKEVIIINENTTEKKNLHALNAQEYAEPVNMFGNEVTLYKFDYAGFLYQE